jgi:hypothetical protein
VPDDATEAVEINREIGIEGRHNGDAYAVKFSIHSWKQKNIGQQSYGNLRWSTAFILLYRARNLLAQKKRMVDAQKPYRVQSLQTHQPLTSTPPASP